MVYLSDPQLTSTTRYAKFPAEEQVLQWATREDDNEGCLEMFLAPLGIDRTEIMVFPQDFSSPLEMDRPLFLEKTVFLIEGEVNCAASANANPQTGIRVSGY